MKDERRMKMGKGEKGEWNWVDGWLPVVSNIEVSVGWVLMLMRFPRDRTMPCNVYEEHN